MDLRYGVPPAFNLIIFLFFSPLSWNAVVSSILVHQFSMLELEFLILAVMFVLLFLFTSADLSLRANPIRFRPGGFSVAITISLIASLSFPPSLFWPIHLLILSSFPLQGLFSLLVKRFCQWVRSLPPWSVVFAPEAEESSNSAPLQDDVELGPMQDHAELGTA